MNSKIVQLLLALVLAIGAAVLNVVWIRSKSPSVTDYLVFKTDVSAGTVIDIEEHLQKISIPDIDKQLPYIFLEFQDRYSLDGWQAVRNFQQGEMVQHADIKPIDSLPEYEVLGPFRLISVGSRLTESTESHSDSSGSGSNAVTIAIKRKVDAKKMSHFDEAARRLLQIVENNALNRGNANEMLRIVAVTTFPEQETGTASNAGKARPASSQKSRSDAEPSVHLADDEIAVFVPLPNVPTIPEVLLADKSFKIGFVVPSIVVRSGVMNQSSNQTTK